MQNPDSQLALWATQVGKDHTIVYVLAGMSLTLCICTAHEPTCIGCPLTTYCGELFPGKILAMLNSSTCANHDSLEYWNCVSEGACTLPALLTNCSTNGWYPARDCLACFFAGALFFYFRFKGVSPDEIVFSIFDCTISSDGLEPMSIS